MSLPRLLSTILESSSDAKSSEVWSPAGPRLTAVRSTSDKGLERSECRPMCPPPTEDTRRRSERHWDRCFRSADPFPMQGAVPLSRVRGCLLWSEVAVGRLGAPPASFTCVFGCGCLCSSPLWLWSVCFVLASSLGLGSVWFAFSGLLRKAVTWTRVSVGMHLLSRSTIPEGLTWRTRQGGGPVPPIT